MSLDRKIVYIYTDGACSGNQNDTNIGGYGAILEYGKHRKELCGGAVNTTNNRMEMTALLEALRAIKKPGQSITIFSDSAYLMECFRKKWYENWQKNQWKTTKKTEVENRDLWEALFAYLPQHRFTFCRVKGHVDLKKPSTNVEKLYEKFLEWNGSGFSPDDFQYITEQNQRADALANEGMEPYRASLPEFATPALDPKA